MPLNYTEPASGPEVATEIITATGVVQHFQVVKLAAGKPGEYDGTLAFGNQVSASSICVIISTQQTPVKINAELQFPQATSLYDEQFNDTSLTESAARIYLFNGGTWDRARGTISYGQQIHLKRIEPEISIEHGHMVFMSGASYQLPSVSGNRAVSVRNSLDSSGTVWLGKTGVSRYKGVELYPGESYTFPLDNSNRLFATGNSIIQILDIIGY